MSSPLEEPDTRRQAVHEGTPSRQKATPMHPLITRSMHLPKPELDFQLSPSQSAKDAAGELEAMVLATTKAQKDQTLRVDLNIRYGPRRRQLYDLYRPDASQGNLPCLVFIHGGFWQEGDKSVSGFAAHHFVRAGWAYVGLGYSLTPDITLKDLVEEVAQAITHLYDSAPEYDIDPNQIRLAGHSAGAHLSACCLCDLAQPSVAQKIAGAVLISGVYDLAPIAQSYVSDRTPMTANDIATLSPLRHTPHRDIPIHLIIGEEEPEAFRLQSEALYAELQSHLGTLTHTQVPGKDHFDILDQLTPNTPHKVNGLRSTPKDSLT